MSDSETSTSTPDNAFSNFSTSDSFNLNEMNGFYGTYILKFIFKYWDIIINAFL